MTVDNVDLRLLRIFMTIVEAGGFAAAQAELNLSLSTISSHISALETRLGVTLCKRGRSGFSLTEEGRMVFEEARHILGTIDQFEEQVRAVRNRLSGAIRVGIVDNTVTDPQAPLEAVFAEFAKAAPAVQLTLLSRPPHELLRDIVAGEIHVAIGSFPRITLGLSYIDLYDETQNFYCGAGHPLFEVPDGEIDVNQVRLHPLIGRDYWGERDLKIFAVGGPRAVVSDMEAEARLILSGAYLGYLPEHYAAGFVASGRMRPIRAELFSYSAHFQLAYNPDRVRSPVVKTFVDIARRHLAAGDR